MTALNEAVSDSNVSAKKPEIRLFPAVNAAIRDSKGRVLLTLRSKKVREPGKWCLPGGHVDPGESWEEACVREVLEETGLKVGKGKVLGVYSDPRVNTVDHPASPSGKGQFVTVVYLFEGYEGEVSPNDEVSEWGWFDPSQPPEPLLSAHVVRLQDFMGFQGEAFSR